MVRYSFFLDIYIFLILRVGMYFITFMSIKRPELMACEDGFKGL